MLTKEQVTEMCNELKRDVWFFEDDLNKFALIINNAFGYYDDGTILYRNLDHPEKISAVLRKLNDECVSRELKGEWECFHFDTFSVNVTYRADQDLF